MHPGQTEEPTGVSALAPVTESATRGASPTAMLLNQTRPLTNRYNYPTRNRNPGACAGSIGGGTTGGAERNCR